MVGVCDGVGGWGEVDVCSGKFSKFLAQKMHELFDADPSRSLKDILVDAVKANPHGGSTTAVLAKLTDNPNPSPLPTAKMSTCNLGDSAYMIVRPRDDHTLVKIHRSKEQTYSFDFPYQCGQNCDLPYDADDAEHTVEHNDIVVLGTDGVTDNLFDEQMIDNCLYPLMGRRGDLPKPEDAA